MSSEHDELPSQDGTEEQVASRNLPPEAEASGDDLQVAQPAELQDNHPSGNDQQLLDAEKRIVDLELRLEAVQREHNDMRDQAHRIAADFDNFRKRANREQSDLKLQLTCSTVREILPVVDSFERARQEPKPETEEARSLYNSYQGLYKQLVNVLKRLGVSPMRVVGTGFDPALHEAIVQEPSDLHGEDVITEELQRGYHLEGRVLRHAMVKVSMGPGPVGAGRSQAAQDDSNEPTFDSGDDDGNHG